MILQGIAVDPDSKVIFRVKFLFTFVDWGDQSLVPNIGEDARAKDDVKEFKYSKLFNISLSLSFSLWDSISNQSEMVACHCN